MYPNQFVPFLVNPAYFVFCSGTPGVQPLQFRCDDVIDQVWDASVGACQFQCQTVGNFVDRLDCHKYYACDVNSQVPGSFILTSQTCPPTYKYSDGRCVKANIACVSQYILDQPKAPQ